MWRSDSGSEKKQVDTKQERKKNISQLRCNLALAFRLNYSN